VRDGQLREPVDQAELAQLGDLHAVAL
jgi:hypothetical protein